jgi:hypothetical protein
LVSPCFLSVLSASVVGFIFLVVAPPRCGELPVFVSLFCIPGLQSSLQFFYLALICGICGNFDFP